MLVLGIDCGLTPRNPVGAALVETDPQPRLVWSACFTPPAKEWVDRVAEVGAWLASWLHESFVLDRRPGLVVYEISHVEENPQVAIQLAHVGGAIAGICGFAKLPVIQVQPAQAKQALTGYHGASKADMMRAARLVFGQVLTKDAADAVGVALAGEGLYRRRRLIETAVSQPGTAP